MYPKTGMSPFLPHKFDSGQMESARKTEMKIEFKNGDIKMAGNLFKPEYVDQAVKNLEAFYKENL